MTSEPGHKRLTSFSSGSGCGCKIAPERLEEILSMSGKAEAFPSLLVGNESRDDAAVLQMKNGTALISTTDFFTPLVDDPFEFGRIASANAISDVYAMGGEPCLAIAILGWPVDDLPASMAAEVLRGARSICSEAGIPLGGGHSISVKEPFFGLAVNGFVTEDNLKKNNTAKEGDLLFLTKPLGSGIMAAAIKRGLIGEEDKQRAIRCMASLNKAGASFGKLAGVHAMTDVTGFGLLGHLIEMTEGSGLSADLRISQIPMLDNIMNYVKQMCFPDNTYRNWNSYEKKCSAAAQQHFVTLCDPQTNGGLLVAVSPGSVRMYHEAAVAAGLEALALMPIGQLTAKAEHVINVVE